MDSRSQGLNTGSDEYYLNLQNVINFLKKEGY